jgi:hypothetical protein
MTKKLLKVGLIALAALLLPLNFAMVVKDNQARAQSAVQTPVYIPSVAFTLGSFTATVSSPTATNAFSVQNQSTTYIRLSGTFTALGAVIQVTEAAPSVASPTWQTVDVKSFNENAWITNITAAGFYQVQTEGVRQIRLLVNAVTITGGNSLVATIAGNTGDRTVGNLPERKRTFSAGNNGVITSSAVGSFFTIFGNATTIVKVKEIYCSVNGAAAATGTLEIDKVSTAFTGGTNTSQTVGPHSSTNVAANSVVAAYTTVPTGGGTLVAPIRVTAGFFPLNTSAPVTVDFKFSQADDQEIILNSATEGLAVKGSASFLYNCFVEWTEN